VYNVVTLLELCYERLASRIYEPRGKKQKEAGEDCRVRSFISCTLHQILLAGKNQEG